MYENVMRTRWYREYKENIRQQKKRFAMVIIKIVFFTIDLAL